MREVPLHLHNIQAHPYLDKTNCTDYPSILRKVSVEKIPVLRHIQITPIFKYENSQHLFLYLEEWTWVKDVMGEADVKAEEYKGSPYHVR